MPNNNQDSSDKAVNPHPALAMVESLKTARSQLRRGFGGLTETFRGVQERLISEFRSTKPIQHPGDVGTARETLIRDFLTKNGYLPTRYGLAPGSSHVLSSSGHISDQIDLLFYDPQSAPKLLSFGDIGYFPIECCYGLIEAKSNINSKNVLHDGLEKLASYKRLKVRRQSQLAPSDGFGILVAHTSSLEWSTLLKSLKDWEAGRERSEWPNLVVVLDQGIIGHASQSRLALHTPQLAAVGDAEAQTLHTEDGVLLCFYLCLIDLLNAINLPPTSLHHYVWLPETSGRHSYVFELGALAEVGDCPHHGQFLRALSEEVLGKILSACPVGSERDVGEALNEAYGDMCTQSLAGGFGRASIYNPDGHPLSRVLVRPCNAPFVPPGAWTLSMDYETVTIDERRFILPQFYIVRDRMIRACPKCKFEAIPEFTIDQWWEIWMRLLEPAGQASTPEEMDGSGSPGEGTV